MMFCGGVAGVLALQCALGAELALPDAKAPPTLQAIPLPHQQVSFEWDGRELARLHFAPNDRRPFVYPMVGPSGRTLTRMGHPHDPVTHSHHNSVWIAHQDVDGVSFWDDRGKGRIVHRQVEALGDGPEEAWALTASEWQAERDAVLLRERRRTAVRGLSNGEWQLVVDVELSAGGTNAVTFGKTPFGLMAVRMAKSIGVRDGGGMIRNSEGGVNEQGVFWKRARWVDYSGPITRDAKEGITLMDHPANPNHPSVFHVRDDGWMGASFTFDGPRVIRPGERLRLRYGLYVHRGVPPPAALEARWERFAREPVPSVEAN